MYTELTILCPECGEMNTVNVDPSTQVQTASCKECGAELRLILRRSRPARDTKIGFKKMRLNKSLKKLVVGGVRYYEY